MDNSRKKIEQEEDYKLLPMSEITDEARIIAVRWMECEDKNWIGHKQKLASDIMNYARRQVAKSISESKQKWTDDDMRQCWNSARGIEDDTIWKGEFDNYMSLKFNYHPNDESPQKTQTK